MQVARCHNIAALRQQAMRRLPRPIFDYIDGGAEDEIALGRATDAFDAIELIPRALVDVSTLRTEVTLFGRRQPWPLFRCRRPASRGSSIVRPRRRSRARRRRRGSAIAFRRWARPRSRRSPQSPMVPPALPDLHLPRSRTDARVRRPGEGGAV
ncbi:alpha-hydroxy-acid oxidizing protein [Sphingomonas sp. MMS24-JH45]